MPIPGHEGFIVGGIVLEPNGDDPGKDLATSTGGFGIEPLE